MKHRLNARLCRRAALCATALFAVSLSFQAAQKTALLPDAAVWALALWGLWALFGALEGLRRPYACGRYWALAALLAFTVTLGQSFFLSGTAQAVLSHKLKAACYFAGRVPLYYAGMRLLEDRLARPAPPRPASALRWGGALLCCWLPWYVCIFPGTVSNDSVTQLKELMGVAPLSNANPLFQTALLAAFRRLGMLLGGADAGVALYCATQAALMAWLLGAVIAEARRAGAPGWLSWGTFAFCALCPVFPVFAFCVGKDTNFAMAALYLSLSVWRLLRGDARARRWVDACLSGVLCVLLRNPGAYLAGATLALLFLRSLARRDRLWRPALCALGCVAGAYLVLHLAVVPALGVPDTPDSENYSIPLQQAARVVSSCELTAAERAGLSGAVDVDGLQAAYNGELSDPVKLLWRADATDAQKRAFFRAWLGLAAKHPATCFAATFHNIYGYLYPGYVSTVKPTLLVGMQAHAEALAGWFDFTVNPLSDFVNSTFASLMKSPLFRLLVAPGLYGWLTLFALVALRRGRRSLLPALPALFSLAGCLLSAVNAYFRYAMPLYLCAPFLLLLCAADHHAPSGKEEIPS